jgi:hypothetical protein
MLVERGARLEARNKKGETPLAVAGGDEVKNVLRTLGAKLFRPDVRRPGRI